MSIRAQLADLLGEDPYEAPPPRVARVSLATAVRTCQDGDVIAAKMGNKELAVVSLPDGRVFALEDRCPHDGGRLSDGFVENGTLVCARHGWEFSVETGECKNRAQCPAIHSASLPALPQGERKPSLPTLALASGKP